MLQVSISMVAQVGIIVAVGVIFVGILLPPFGIVADKLSRYHERLQIIIGSFIGIIIFIVPLCHDFITLLLVNVKRMKGIKKK